MKQAVKFFLWVVVMIFLVVVVKTLFFTSLQEEPGEAVATVGSSEAAGRLGEAVRIATVSYEEGMPVDTALFLEFITFLEESYPAVHSETELTIINDLSLLYRWQGTNSSLKPVILMAHYDVVPEGDVELWDRPPFSGEIADGFIWGRGTLDDKGSLIQIMEAVETLIGEGFTPERSLYLAFGHDEEISGTMGASQIAAYLESKGVEAEFVADEGMAVTVGMVPMVTTPVALIGTSEKGYISVRLSVRMDGGHSSTPESESAVTLIADAVSRLHAKQVKPRISEPVEEFIRYIGPEMPFYARAIFANRWLFNRVLINIYTSSSGGNALVRTTTTPTIVTAGMKDNVIPSSASAVINFRILAGESSEDVLEHIRKVTDDERILLEILPGLKEPALVSPASGFGFESIASTVRQVYPEAVVAPTIMLAASDSRHYSGVSSNIYRFAPIIVTQEDMARIHGVNERVRVDDFLRGITYYYHLIRNANKAAG